MRRVALAVLLAGVVPWLVTLAASAILGDAQRVQEPLHEGLEITGTCIALVVAMIMMLGCDTTNRRRTSFG